MDSAAQADRWSLADLLSASMGPFTGMLSRPVVQWQLLTILVILGIAWFVPKAIYRSRTRPDPDEAQRERGAGWRRWTVGLREVLAPVIALLLLSAASWLFRRYGVPYGILDQFQAIVWLWLIYKIVVSLVYARYGPAARPYQRRLLTPVFVVLVIWQGLNIVPWVTEIWETTVGIGSVAVTLGGMVSSLVILYLFFVGAWVVEQALNRNLPERLNAEPNVVASVSILVRYAVSALGIVVALGALGFDATSLAIVAGGLSVGIGIGLQDIVANFISGLILLAEQSLRPGDIIEVDGRISTVERISLRATTVITRDNVELIIPNATFTTGEVTNFTKTAPLVRVLVPVGVSYQSDPRQVRQILEDTAPNHPLVLSDPAPLVLFRAYGESSLDFELAVWVNRPERMALVRSELYFMLWTALAEKGIEIPFPQRDLHLRSGWEQLGREPESG